MADYKSREYCKAIACEVQLELEKHEKGTPQYENIKQKCKTSCIKTAGTARHCQVPNSMTGFRNKTIESQNNYFL
jgi:hypothetical protein